MHTQGELGLMHNQAIADYSLKVLLLSEDRGSLRIVKECTVASQYTGRSAIEAYLDLTKDDATEGGGQWCHANADRVVFRVVATSAHRCTEGFPD